MSVKDESEALRARVVALEAELAAAREQADVFGGVLAAVPVIVMQLDASYRFLDISRVVSGMTREQVIDTPFLAHVPDPEREKLTAIFDRVIASGTAERYETVGTGPDGTTAEYDSYVTRTRDRHGAYGLVVVAIDVTDRLRRERAFVTSEEAGRLAVEATGIGLWSIDIGSGKVTWNDAMYRICGVETALSPAEYTAKLVHPEDRARATVNEGGYLAEDRFQDRAMRIVRPDGDVRWVVNSGRVLRDRGGTPAQVIGITLDVTIERMMDERLRQSQRLEAVGQLAAGVAHNFNNILASIVPVLDLIAPHALPHHRPLVEGASHSAGRAAELVRQLMTFAGQRAFASRKSACLATLARSAQSLCQNLIDPRITLLVEDRSGGVLVRCDPGAIEQAIVNLVLNARDAIEETEHGKGTIRVEISREVDAVVRVTDDGVGMPEAVAGRVFEPFFTTKDVGRGTGLGLPVTYATVRDHGGLITCTSEVGAGAVFELRLPVDVAPVHETVHEAQPVAVCTRKILLVDDDADVRASMAALLADLGQVLVVAKTASEALERARLAPDISLVILDRAMPFETGDAIVPALRAMLPGAPIVFFTGEDVDERARGMVFAVLAKPASRSALLSLFARLDHLALDTSGRAS